MDTSMMKRLKELEHKNTLLKRMFAGSQMDNEILKETLKSSKARASKVIGGVGYRQVVMFAAKNCRLYGVNRSTVRHVARIPDAKAEIKELLMCLAESHKCWGFGLMFRWMHHQGYRWNHKRVYKIYCELTLNLRIKPKRRLPTRNPIALHQPVEPNSFWSMDLAWSRHWGHFRPHHSAPSSVESTCGLEKMMLDSHCNNDDIR
jgi:putative transposase